MSSFDLQRSENLTTGLNRLRISSFDVVVLDLSLPDSQGIDALVAVRNECPDTPIVVLGDDEDPSIGMRVLSEGAQDYVTKATWNPAALPRILRFGIERHNTGRPSATAKDGKLLTFVGAKGGAGTTTVCLNVAAALASPIQTTIATEWCWPRGNFSIYLGEQPARNLSAIGTLPPRAITKSVLKNLLATTSNNLMLLHGPQTNGRHRCTMAPFSRPRKEIPVQIASAFVNRVSIVANAFAISVEKICMLATAQSASKAATSAYSIRS